MDGSLGVYYLILSTLVHIEIFYNQKSKIHLFYFPFECKIKFKLLSLKFKIKYPIFFSSLISCITEFDYSSLPFTTRLVYSVSVIYLQILSIVVSSTQALPFPWTFLNNLNPQWLLFCCPLKNCRFKLLFCLYLEFNV